MPPSLASIVFWAFIAWLVYRDSKNAETSLGLWLPTISLSIMASKPVVYWLYGQPVGDLTGYEEAASGNATDRNFLLVLFFLGIVTLIRRGISVRELISKNLALCALVFYMACSVAWSEQPLIAFKRYVREIGHLVMILVVLTDKNPSQAIRSVLVRCIYVLVPLSVLYVKYYPELGRYYSRWTWTTMYSGVTNNKNSLGLLAMLGLLVMTWSILDMIHRKRPKSEVFGEGIVLAMSVWLLTIANSKTALACSIVGAVVFFGARTEWMKAKPSRLTLGMWAALVLSAVLLMSPASRGFVAESMGRDPSLTTRTDIWASVLDLKTNFLFGAGYNSVWLTDAGRQLAERLEVPHAHNGYLETYLNLGIIGASLLVIVLLSACRNAARQSVTGSILGPLLAALCLSGMIYNYSEVTFGRDNAVSFCLMLAALRISQPAALRHSNTPLPLSRRTTRNWTPLVAGARRLQPQVRRGSARGSYS